MTWVKQTKHSANFNIISYLLCESEDPLVQENNYYILLLDSVGDKHYSVFINASKNSASWSNQSKS